jgi:transposase
VRAAWWTATAAALRAADCLFLDESGAHIAHTRAYAYAPRAERATGRAPTNRGAVTTLIACLTPTGMGPCQTVVGGTTKARFLAYLTEHLGPTLRPGQVVVLDNLGAHHAREVAGVLAAAGVRVVYLPPYSPDMNPIELAFGKVKAALKRIAVRTRDALELAIQEALATITAADARAFYAHCGFPLPAADEGQQ